MPFAISRTDCGRDGVQSISPAAPLGKAPSQPGAESSLSWTTFQNADGCRSSLLCYGTSNLNLTCMMSLGAGELMDLMLSQKARHITRATDRVRGIQGVRVLASRGQSGQVGGEIKHGGRVLLHQPCGLPLPARPFLQLSQRLSSQLASSQGVCL